MQNQFILDTLIHLGEDDEMMIMCILSIVILVVGCTILAQKIAEIQ